MNAWPGPGIVRAGPWRFTNAAWHGSTTSGKARARNGTRFLEETHPYAADLDLFGSGSLFELLCTARTQTGEETLASWLKAAGLARRDSRSPTSGRRAEALARSAGRHRFARRQRVRRRRFRGRRHLGRRAPILQRLWLRWVALGIALLAAASLALWLLTFTDAALVLFLCMIGVELVFAGVLFSQVKQVLRAVDKRAGDLALLANVLERLERASFTSPRSA